MWMKIVQATLSLTLAISGLLGIQILIDDKWLWAAAPSHAYGLIGFVSIDMILVVVALVRVGLATVSAALMAVAGARPEGGASANCRRCRLLPAAD